MVNLPTAAEARQIVDNARIEATNRRLVHDMMTLKAAINKAISENMYTTSVYNICDGAIAAAVDGGYDVKVYNEEGARTVIISW